MSKKVDYKKDFKPLYVPTTEPCVLTVPAFKFVVIAGEGDPNGDSFAEDTAALYSISYAVKMSYKGNHVPTGYYEYTVFPLEGEWDLIDPGKTIADKNNFRYRIMIRQPEFLSPELFQRFLRETKKKKPNPSLDKMIFEEREEGLCCQMLHMGPYADEPKSFSRMEQFCTENGYTRLHKKHREIYLSDPRNTDPTKMKTVLRFQVKAKG